MAKKTPSRPKRKRATAAAAPPLPPTLCPVVAFGASAGGLEAFSEMLQHLPIDTGMSFVLIQHLDPRHESLLTELLAKATAMPVVQVKDGMRTEPNHVYVLPPNANITISSGVLHLEARTSPHMPVDHFFRSLAQDQGTKAIGVILSGTASDGTQGLTAIKAEGGITFAQDEKSAKYDGMPRSAVMAGCVDFVLPPEGIARELVRLCRHPYSRSAPHGEEEAGADTGAQFAEILAMLRKTTSVDFVYYKHATVQRRILRRMAMHSMQGLDEYTNFLRRHPEELTALFQDILINVTSFFRESATFDLLREKVFPQLFRGRAADDFVRVWVPGCSTGEEAYSTAICLIEYMRENDLDIGLQVFGTDLSETVLEKARAGIYPESIAADVSPERLRRFFVKTNGTYQIGRSIRDMCIFARQNLTKDPPFSRLDLILCRNVLIYLGPALQVKVMRYFHYGLKPTGFLALGVSESIGAATALFTPILGKEKVYTRNNTPTMSNLEIGSFEERPALAAKGVEPWGTVPDLHKRVDQLILARHSPPGVVVDEELQVLQFRGHTAPFLEHTAGQPSLNLLKMTRGTVALELRKLIHKARKTGSSVRSEPMQLSSAEGFRPMRITVSPIKAINGNPTAYLLLFEAEAAPTGARTASKKGAAKTPAGSRRIVELEEELNLTKQYLQTVIEEQEAASEELKSAHEEVQSSNEELQSTNEELLTSKEELQSTNEELNTVNEEMQARNAELTQINDDLNNLLSSVNLPIVMVGNDLRIRRFTPYAEKVLSLISTDAGRRLTDFRLKIDIPDLEGLFLEVIDSLQTKEREVQDQEGRTYLMSIRPYRTLENRIDGAVMSLYDITDRKQSAEVRYRRLFEASKDGMLIAETRTGRVLDVNPFIAKLSGYPRNELLAMKLADEALFQGEALERIIGLKDGDTYLATMPMRTKDGQAVDVEVLANGYMEGLTTVVQLNVRDVSARVQAEEIRRREDLQLLHAEKMEAVGRLAGGVAHDFNNLLTAVVGYSDLLKSKVSDQTVLRDLERIREAGERATALTRQLLAFGRKQMLHPSVLDLNVVIADMDQILGVLVTEKVRLVMKPGSELGSVKVDRAQLEQVLTYLVMNARDAMPDGGEITVETAHVIADAGFVQTHRSVPPGDYVMLSVSDTGTGMDAETQSHLFEPFFTTKPRGLGSGLGLATIHGIVKESGGHIWAFSELGQGTTFQIYFPRVDEQTDPVESRPASVSPPRGSETILLVEDEPLVRRLASTVLRDSGYRVLEASSGPEALRVAGSHEGSIDLLLTDVVMPHMSGREAADRIAADRRDMKVLFVSGHPEDAIVHHGVLDPEFEFLPKPFTPEILTVKVREVLDGRK